jgi:outer membrane protein OmpA-like peptidoglycan-associated protein
MRTRLTGFLAMIFLVSSLVVGGITLSAPLVFAQTDTTKSNINFDDLTADADKPLFLRYGIFGGNNWNWHDANFTDFANLPTCCGTFYGPTLGTLPRWYAGVLFETPFNMPQLQNRLGLGLRLSYTDYGVRLARTEDLLAQTRSGQAQPVPIEHSKTITLNAIAFEPMLNYRVLDGLTISLGLRANYYFQRGVSYVETMATDTTNFLLPDGRASSTRNRITVDSIPQSNPLNLALIGGISYEIPLDANGKWLIAPEAFFMFGALPLGQLSTPANNLVRRVQLSPEPGNSETSVGSWTFNNLRAGLSLRYSPYRTIRPELTPALQETIKQIKKLDSAITVERQQNAKRLQQVDSINKAITAKVAELKKVGISVNISKVVGVDASGKEIPNPKLVVEQFRKSLTQPILPAVFFDENSFTPASRYRRLRAADRGTFKLADVGGKGNLDAYRQILNVVGKRMEENPAAVLFLTGCNANVGPEAGNQKLSEQRAQAISDYLQDVWKIPAKRLIIQKRDLPENPSNSADATGAAENRRVEMSSNLPEIFAPLKTDQVARIPNPPTIRFGIEINAGAGLKQWALEASQFNDDESVTLKEFQGTNNNPPEVDWKLDLEPNSVPSSGQDITVQLSMTDINNKTGDAPLVSIPVEQINVQKKELDGKADIKIDVIDVVGFTGGATPQLDEVNTKTLNDLKATLKPNASVFINAYTDNNGDAAQNKQLAQKRAEFVAKTLGVTNAKINAVGPTTIHDNSQPEGRMYNRLVRIEVQTPTK